MSARLQYRKVQEKHESKIAKIAENRDNLASAAAYRHLHHLMGSPVAHLIYGLGRYGDMYAAQHYGESVSSDHVMGEAILEIATTIKNKIFSGDLGGLDGGWVSELLSDTLVNEGFTQKQIDMGEL